MWYQRVVAHGFVGGTMSVAQGGKFGHGFVSAGASAGSGPWIDGMDSIGAGGRIAVAALVGGTVSAATGGKFGNGAVTAAFSQAFNGENHRKLTKREHAATANRAKQLHRMIHMMKEDQYAEFFPDLIEGGYEPGNSHHENAIMISQLSVKSELVKMWADHAASTLVLSLADAVYEPTQAIGGGIVGYSLGNVSRAAEVGWEVYDTGGSLWEHAGQWLPWAKPEVRIGCHHEGTCTFFLGE